MPVKTGQDATIYTRDQRTLRFVVTGIDPNTADDIYFCTEGGVIRVFQSQGTQITTPDSDKIDVELTEEDTNVPPQVVSYALTIEKEGQEIVVATGDLTIRPSFK